MNTRPAVAIAGASVRAAAQSAVRAGFDVYAFDLFGDADLRNIATCKVIPADEYPRGIPRLLEELAPMPCFFTGAMENHPEVVQKVSEQREVLGNGAGVLRCIRDPFELAAVLEKNKLPVANVLATPPEASYGDWIRKPFKSAGGGRIRLAETSDSQQRVSDPAYYFQRLVEGVSYSGVYVMAGGSSVLLGVTRQLHGRDFEGQSPFSYAGSIGHVSCEPEMLRQWQRTGQVLADAFDLKGLVGVDAIVTPDGDLYVVEVNPRFTASMELFELAGLPLFRFHLDACRGTSLPDQDDACAVADQLRGKAIAFAGASSLEITQEFSAFCMQQANGQEPSIADVPLPGQQIQPGHPVATVFARGKTAPQVQQRLKESVAALLKRATKKLRQTAD